MLDVLDFIQERGGNPQAIRDSQRRRYANVDAVDEVIALFEDHRKSSVPRLVHLWKLESDLRRIQRSMLPRR